jgi:hypothetical protein
MHGVMIFSQKIEEFAYDQQATFAMQGDKHFFLVLR